MKIFKKRINEILSKLDSSLFIIVSEAANFFGQHSKGHLQVRGNGVLILMKTGLYFEMWRPKKVLEISINSIKEIEKVRTFLGKSRFRDLIKVGFINNEQEEDATAWLVNNPDEWIHNVKKLKPSSN